jgi:cellulose synthase/poly-beta-1,6-N-acetylglucosamine synthase-like glycosyltransferase
MNLVYTLFICVLFFLYIWVLYNVPVLAVGVKHLKRTNLKKKKTKSNPEKLPTFSIIVPVRNEERVVDRLLKALFKLDYPPEKREIIIVEDGSIDKTPRICRKYAKRHPDCIKFVRQSMSNGKPSALNYALKHARGEIVAVFDADNVPEPDVLLRAAEYFEDSSVAAVQGTPCAINANENMLTKFVSHEEAVRFQAYFRGKDALGLFVPLTGTCQFIRRTVLEEVGGWNEESLSEDMEMSAKLTQRGHTVKYAPDIRSWQENPANLTQFVKQRTRWFRGCMEVALRYGKLLKTFNRKSIDAEVTLVGPYMLIPFLIGYLIALHAFFVPVKSDPVFTIMTRVTTLLTTVTLLLEGIALIYVTKPRKITNLLWLPFIYAYWSLQTFIAAYAFIQIVFKRPKKWKKTIKTGAVTNGQRSMTTK